jgi:hypothetical protein
MTCSAQPGKLSTTSPSDVPTPALSKRMIGRVRARGNERRVPVVHCAAEVLEEHQGWIWGIEVAKVAIDITAGVGAVCWVVIVSVCQKEKA